MTKLSALSRTIDLEIKWTDEASLNIRVKPDEYTGKRLEQMQESLKEVNGEESAEFRFMCGFLAELVVSWDLTDDDEVPIEISEESFHSVLPATVVAKLLQEIQRGVVVNPQKPEL